MLTKFYLSLIYRLPPLPPTSPALDDSMNRLLLAWQELARMLTYLVHELWPLLENWCSRPGVLEAAGLESSVKVDEVEGWMVDW